MSKITRANIAAAKAQRDILIRRKRAVPERIARLAELDPDRLPREQEDTQPDQQAGPSQGKVPTATDAGPLAHPAAGAVPSWVRSVLLDQFWPTTPGAKLVFPAFTDATVSKLSDFSAFTDRWASMAGLRRTTCVLYDSPNVSQIALYMVDASNAGRAEQVIHDEGGLGASSPHRPEGR